MNFQTHNWYPWSKAEKEREEGRKYLYTGDVKNHENLETEGLGTLNLF